MRLYIIRHGQTEWNSSYRLQGRTDIPLNESGRELARRTGRALALQGIHFDQICTSPLSRARETAELVMLEQVATKDAELKPGMSEPEAGSSVIEGQTVTEIGGITGDALCRVEFLQNMVRIREEPRIQEISFGVMEGERVRDENGTLTDDNYICFFNDPEQYTPPDGGESFQELIARTGDFLNEMKDKKDTLQTVLVSTHGAASRALLANISRCPLRDFWSGGVPKNCAVTIAELENGEWKIKEQDIIYYGNENI